MHPRYTTTDTEPAHDAAAEVSDRLKMIGLLGERVAEGRMLPADALDLATRLCVGARLVITP